MRRLLASSIAASVGVACATALALPPAPPAAAATARPAASRDGSGPAAVRHDPPGSTRSLPLHPLGPGARDRAVGSPAAGELGLTRRDVRHFSMVGVVWDDPGTELHGRVQVRTRAAGSGVWSGWRNLETHNDDAADPGTPERGSGRVHGATAPLWVGDSDGVEVRIRAEAAPRTAPRTATPAPGTRAAPPASALPSGLRLELVDPGGKAEGEGGAQAAPYAAPAGVPRPGALGAGAAEERAASAANAGLAPLGATEIPALSRTATERELQTLGGGEPAAGQRAKPYIGPRPRIITRHGWGANERLREKGFVYTRKVKVAFVHHTSSGNGYRCSQAASVIRGIYRYHVTSMGWRDLGYNFLVDKCGNIYEGRAGGVAKAVLGAHTLGFNTDSMGVAVIGSFGSHRPPAAALRAVSRLTAWKLGLYGANPRGRTYLKSGGGNLYRKGKKVRLHVISGHRDGYATACPGTQLYRRLGTARTTAARYQGR
ncbi:peptidoglycan recognition protein family protein [Streptomyces sediminimaris]|uniref:peptidoglycan recognition protein family protein n=1 Tax=Streptomyces sediminimaris TaxID=3383721 RepID=UPI00399B2B80